MLSGSQAVSDSARPQLKQDAEAEKLDQPEQELQQEVQQQHHQLPAQPQCQRKDKQHSKKALEKEARKKQREHFRVCKLRKRKKAAQARRQKKRRMEALLVLGPELPPEEVGQHSEQQADQQRDAGEQTTLLPVQLMDRMLAESSRASTCLVAQTSADPGAEAALQTSHESALGTLGGSSGGSGTHGIASQAEAAPAAPPAAPQDALDLQVSKPINTLS